MNAICLFEKIKDNECWSCLRSYEGRHVTLWNWVNWFNRFQMFLISEIRYTWRYWYQSIALAILSLSSFQIWRSYDILHETIHILTLIRFRYHWRWKVPTSKISTVWTVKFLQNYVTTQNTKSEWKIITLFQPKMMWNRSCVENNNKRCE